MRSLRVRVALSVLGALVVLGAAGAGVSALAPTASASGGSLLASTFAGSSVSVLDGVPAVQSEAVMPFDAAANALGVYVADGVHVRFVPTTSGTYYGQSMVGGDVYTIGGDGSGNYSGDGGPATSAGMNPRALAVDSAGNVFFADDSMWGIRVIAGTTGTLLGQSVTAGNVYAVAGDGSTTVSGDGGPATSAGMQPSGIALDAAGDIFFTDSTNNVVRYIPASSCASSCAYGLSSTTAGDVYTIAGTAGSSGSSGDGSAASGALLSSPYGIAVDSSDDVFIADSGNSRVRMIAGTTGTTLGVATTAGDIYTVAGNGSTGTAPSGLAATSSEITDPESVAVSNAGLSIGANGDVLYDFVPFNTGTYFGQSMTADDLYAVAGVFGAHGWSSDGGPATAAQFNPSGWGWVAADPSGNLLVADTGNEKVRAIAIASGTDFGQAMTAGDIYNVVGASNFGAFGDGGPASSAFVNGPDGIATDAAGDVAIAASGDRRVRFVPKTSGTYFGQSMTAGDVYTIAGDGGAGSAPNAVAATAAQIAPTGIFLDSGGDLVIASNQRILFVPKMSGTYFGQSMVAGDVYTVAGTGTYGFSGDNGPATAAELGDPNGPVVDAAGDIVFADTANSRIRLVAATSCASSCPYGLASTTAGNIYTIAGNGTDGFSTPSGVATATELGNPEQIAIDAAGDLAIADAADSVVWMLPASSGTHLGQAMVAGDIYAVAGDGTSGSTGDGGPATAAEFQMPYGVAFDPSGGLLVVDMTAQVVRYVAPSSGTFYGQAMTTGDVYTVAGTGAAGYAGDGGPATAAKFNYALALAVAPSGTIYVADNGNNVVRALFAGSAPSLTSAASTSFAPGVAGSFMVVATGTPTPTLSESGALPAGVTFVDNGDGTATLAGTAASPGTATFTITATNGVGTPATQSFTLTVAAPVSPTSPASSTSTTAPPAPTPQVAPTPPTGFGHESTGAVVPGHDLHVDAPGNGHASAIVTALDGALPGGTTVGIAETTPASHPVRGIPGDDALSDAVYVSWSASDGSVPRPTRPLEVTLSGPAVVASDIVFGVVQSGGPVELATVPATGSVTVAVNAPQLLYVAAPPRVALASRVVDATSRFASVRLSCVSGTTCVGSASTLSVARYPVLQHGAATHPMLAHARFVIGEGKTRVVRFPMTAFGRKLLARAVAAEHRHRSFAVTLLVETTDGNRLVERLVLR